MSRMTLELHRLLRGYRKMQRMPNLGGRELEVMKILWGEGQLSAQQVLKRSTDNTLSLSTMQSTLERLHRKALLHRQKSGRHYIYDAALSRSAFISHLLRDIAETIGDGDMAPMVSGFISFIDHEDRASVPNDVRKIIDRLSAEADE